MGEFKNLLEKVNAGSAIDFERLIVIYKGMLTTQSMINGKIDEDLYQELLVTLYYAVQHFKTDVK